MAARCRRLLKTKLCRFAMPMPMAWVELKLRVTLADYTSVFAKNMEKFVRNFRSLILLLIQSMVVLRVINVKAVVSGKCQIPVEVVSPTVRTILA